METALELALEDRPLIQSDSPPQLPEKTSKPWGHELLWACGQRYAAKILHIHAGHRLSLQYHLVKEETLLLMEGRVIVELEQPNGDLDRFEAVPGQVVHIAPQRKHRLTAVETSDVLEVSTPELGDLIRLEDDFGRR